jgi:predicted CopG family antitoxin
MGSHAVISRESGVRQFSRRHLLREEDTMTTKTEVTAAREALLRADDMYREVLIKFYGKKKAGDARYFKTHSDKEVSDAQKAFHVASNEYHHLWNMQRVRDSLAASGNAA